MDLASGNQTWQRKIRELNGDFFFCSENHRNINGWIFQQATYSKAEKTEKIAQEMITILVVALLFYIWGCHMDKTNHFTLIDIEIIYDNKFFLKKIFFHWDVCIQPKLWYLGDI